MKLQILALAILFASTIPLAACNQPEGDKLTVKSWDDEVDGKKVSLYTLTNKNGLTAKVTNWGAVLTELQTKDKDGNLADIVLGYDTLGKWLDSAGDGKANPSYFGCTVGRYCNRIGGGKFKIGEEEYTLAKNNGDNHLHGGNVGWDKQVWDAEVLSDQSVKFMLSSPDGQEGYPGTVKAEVIYTLTDDDELKIEHSATTDKATPVNMTNHTYFNLSGQGNGTILDHECKLESDRITVFGEGDIPTGEFKPVADTVFDFTESTPIGKRIDQLPANAETGSPGGYDQNFVLRDKKSETPELAATFYDPKSGRVLKVFTTEVGAQLYSGNYLDGSLVGKGDKKYDKHFAFCFEPQFHPDSPNKSDFPSCVLQPGETYNHVTVFKFETK